MAGREGKRGECQTRLGSVWRESGAVRNARPGRGQAASTRKRAQWNKSRSHLEYGWRRVVGMLRKEWDCFRTPGSFQHLIP